MRVGQNPAKSIDRVAQPARVTVAVVTYIPFLGGYYAESLDVLKACLESIWENTHTSYDLLVFDNASCSEVRAYLREAQDQGRIQYLLLSEKNVGKGGAWNIIFGGAPGEFIAYADSDVYFYPGWLSAQLSLFEKFPRLGMVTGAPLRIPEEYSSSTIRWAEKEPQASLERGVILSWEDWWKHAKSLGVESEQEGRALYDANQDVCLSYQGERYYVGAAHFQFLARREILRQVIPIPSERPMGQVRTLDVAVDELGYLRLSTEQWYVQHLGNSLGDFQAHHSTPEKAKKSGGALWRWKPARKILVWFYNKAFEILYRT